MGQVPAFDGVPPLIIPNRPHGTRADVQSRRQSTSQRRTTRSLGRRR
jgi:hypothetical protein